jgi:ribosomal-protein-alanine N-acetyltransferase
MTMLQFHIPTERLLLRDLSPEDAEGMFELDSDAEVHRYLGGKPVKSLEESERVIDIIRAQYARNGIGRWAVIEKSTGNFVGWSGLKLITEPINGRSGYYDLGYRFIKRYWGKGYATEAANAAVQYAWDDLKLRELYAMADMDNKASRRVLEKTGMRFSGEFDYDGSRHAWYKLVKSDAGL